MHLFFKKLHHLTSLSFGENVFQSVSMISGLDFKHQDIPNIQLRVVRPTEDERIGLYVIGKWDNL